MVRQSQSQLSTQDLVESMRQDARREILAGLAPVVGALAAEMAAAGIPLDGSFKALKSGGRKPGRPAVVKGGAPHGEVYTEGGRGRTECPNCHAIIAARGDNCPNCFYNKTQGKVLPYQDAEGQPIVAPFYKKGGKGAKAAAATPAGTKQTRNNKAPTDFGSKLNDTDLDKSTKKILAHAKPGGILFKDVMVKVVKEHGLTGEPGRGFTMRLMQSMKRTGIQNKADKTWSKKAA